MSNSVYHLGVIGCPTSGKTTLSKRIEEKPGFIYFPNDGIRQNLFGKKHPLDLTSLEWTMLYSERNARKYVELLEGNHVITDSCPYNNELRRMTMQLSPYMLKKLKEKDLEVNRKLIVLDVDKDIILQRTADAGRTDKKDTDYINWFFNVWEPADGFSDQYGPIEVLTYKNNEEEDFNFMLNDLGEKLSLSL